MKFKDYVKNLVTELENNPEVGEYKTVYSSDDEGNSFQTVEFTPSCGYFDGKYQGEFYHQEDLPYWFKDEKDEKINAICIN